MLPSGLPDEVDDDEDLARFLTQRSYFNSSQVKHTAFLPSGAGETSVSRHGAEPSERLWDLGRTAAGPRKLHGAAILKASVVRELALTILADEPPSFHAVIRNWPRDSDPDLEKSKRKELAMVLAGAAGAPLRIDIE